MQREKERD